MPLIWFMLSVATIVGPLSANAASTGLSDLVSEADARSIIVGLELLPILETRGQARGTTPG